MNNLSFAELRTRHPRFVYQSYRMEHDSGELRLAYSFRLEPDISFEPQITLPCAQPEILPQLENMVFQLGLVEMISYWKAACPPVIEIPCGSLNGGQIAWWKDLLLHGLGEFFLRNAIDFRAPDFLRFDISASLPPGSQAPAFSPDDAELILVGGGKDSALTIELLRGLPKQRAAFMLNPMPSSIKSATLGGITRQLIARRRIDPRLLELNRSGYLNGHTPFSA
ncbi:MAG TPA: hypothetical protein PLP17_13210, partial [Oligoflexia bacterium]|nr:hypothetical protein [Oligoflexia bacterium]